MEGSWRALCAWLAATLAGCALILGASGCVDDESSAVGPGAVRTADPERTFAPLLEVAADEPWRPMSARWLIEHAVFGAAGCGDRTIAVGRTMPERRTVNSTNWIFPSGLGHGPNHYDRTAFDSNCELDAERRIYADQLTRPRDPGPRVEGLSSDQGFYLDLVDEARGGPALGARIVTPAYVERVDEGDSGIRLTYWTLYGMSGTAGDASAHEGDWEHVDVVLRADGDRYEPLAVQAADDVPWSAVRSVDGTHPVVSVERKSHTMTAARRGAGCGDCVHWRTWDTLADARKQHWYGFGGAWGEVGPTGASTGPLGPHGYWPTAAEKAHAVSESLEL
jgi:hypothetical protein